MRAAEIVNSFTKIIDFYPEPKTGDITTSKKQCLIQGC